MLVKHLLTHTSGLTYSTDITGVGDVAQAYKDLKILFWTRMYKRSYDFRGTH